MNSGEINIGQIVAWVLFGVGFSGYLIWKQLSESRIKKQATALKETVEPHQIKIKEINLSRYGITGIFLSIQRELLS